MTVDAPTATSGEPSISASGPHRAFHTLDGIRGVAALIIVMRHAGSYFTGVAFKESFLAVDMFFLLSGFVIAFAYGAKIASGNLNLIQFLKIRLIRLYPLYLLGLIIGIIYAAGSMKHAAGGWHVGNLLEAIGMAILMLPGLKGVVTNGSALNAPTWSLFPELLANAVYAAFWRLMTISTLIAIVAAGALGIIFCEYKFGTLDLGWDLNTYIVSISRVTFSFFLGITIFKLLGDRRSTNNLVSWACLIATAAALLITPPEGLRSAYEIAMVVFAFPCIMAFACRSEPGPQSGKVMRFLGLISYAVYTLHAPSAKLIGGLADRVAHIKVEQFAPGIGFVFIGFIVIFAWLADKYYDAPLRKSLTLAILRKKR